MNWDIISAVSEFTGVIAVVISLLYVSRQISMSNRLARAEASRTPTSDLNMLNASFGSNQDFRTALRKTIEGQQRIFRNGENPYPGPFTIPKNKAQYVRIWPSSKTPRARMTGF